MKRRRCCPFPHKEKLSKAEARTRAALLNARQYDGRAVRPYRCPAGGHHHVGHPRPRRQR